MRKSTTMGQAAMEWILSTFERQGESLVDTFHISYIIKGRSLNSAAIYYREYCGREISRTCDVETVGHSIDVQT
jgi:hypothetical protein